MGRQGAELPPHVLVFPLPFQGHVNPMLKRAELLCLADIHVTMLISDFSLARLLKHANLQSRFAHYPGFCFRTITDGLPDYHPRASERAIEIVPAMKTVTGPIFKAMMISNNCFASENRRPVTCIIADGVLSFAGDFALERGIPLIYFHTASSCCFWACFHMHELIEAGDIPLKGNGMDMLVSSVSGMEGFLRRRDLPGFCRVNDMTDPYLQIIMSECRETPRAQGIIQNTFDDLEGPILSQICNPCPNLYSIGPLHAHLKARLAKRMKSTTTASNSFWEADWSCMTWLDSQPSKSVIYVSFGSITVMTRDRLLEFWYGLVNSGQRFLWVIRPHSITDNNGESQIPTELLDGTKERGHMVGWAPQEEVLAHPAIGGFLTHSGWNSSLESKIAGVPMICWPYFADQFINSRFVSEVWKLGLDMKDTCNRLIIETMIRDLMNVRKDEFQQRANQIEKLAKQAVHEGGSSYNNLGRLIDYIKSTII